MRKFAKKTEFTILTILVVLFTVFLVCACDNKQKEIIVPREFTLCYLAGECGTVDGELDQRVCEGADGSTVTAVANEGYRFVEWSDGIRTAERTDKGVIEDVTVTARFERIGHIVLYQTDGNGTIEGEATQSVKYGENTTVVKAVPNEGYRFVEWSDGIKTAERTDKNISANKTVTAKFERNSYMVEYRTDGNGTIEGATVQSVKFGENTTMVTAIAQTGYCFIEWSDGVKTANRIDKNISADKTVTAKFEKMSVTVQYQIYEEDVGYGIIKGVETQILSYGENATPVTAVPNKGYLFVGWSDGVETAERQDLNITENLTVIAVFDSGYVYDYKVYNGIGGTIQGKTHQMVTSTEELESVTAVPKNGYIFTGWSDHEWKETRKDEIDRKFDYQKSFGYIAYFEPIQKQFRYDYGLAQGVPAMMEITLSRESIETAEFVIPKLDGYTFCGWYADRDYKIKIADWDGRYMYGYAAFTLDSDTLYAKWKRDDEKGEIPVFKILLVFVDELKATLYSSLPNGTDGPISVHRIMSTLDRKICALIPQLMSDKLNAWLKDVAEFEIDCFYTTQTVTEEYIRYIPKVSGQYSFDTFEFPQIDTLVSSYHSVTGVFGVNDFENRLLNRNIVGMAGKKYADVYLDGIYLGEYLNRDPFESVFTRLKNDTEKQEEVLGTFIHEMIHTIELLYPSDEILDYHGVCTEMSHIEHAPFEAERRYLLGEAFYKGKIGGIPRNFWTDKKDEMLKRIVW